MRLKEGTAWQEIDGKVIAVSPDGGKAYVFAGRSPEVFAALDNRDAVPEGEEASSFLSCLEALGLLEGAEASGAPASHPWLLQTQETEVLAAVCDSVREGEPGTCRTFGSCSVAFE